MRGDEVAKFVEFANLLAYLARRGSNLEESLYAMEALARDPIKYWEILKRAEKLPYGVRRTVEWLEREGYPEEAIAPFLVERRIGIGWSAGFFFSNFFRANRAMLRFVSRHREPKKTFDNLLTKFAEHARLVDIGGVISWVSSKLLYLFTVEIEDYSENTRVQIVYDTALEDRVHVDIIIENQYGRVSLPRGLPPSYELRGEVVYILKERLQEGHIDRESIRKHVESFSDDEKFRFEHVYTALKSLC